MPILRYDLTQEPTGKTYGDLIDFATSICRTTLLVVRREYCNKLSTEGEKILESMKPFQIEIKRSSRWPGTELVGHKAMIYSFQSLPELSKILKEAANSLYSWVQPPLPEDLCFLRSDNTPLLITIAHENWSSLDITDREKDELEKVTPDLFALLKLDNVV